MDYKKKYKDALERAKAINEGKTTGKMGETVCEYIFPELKESEDETIKKEIIDFVVGNTILEDGRRDRWLAWLEKQKEQVELNNIYVRGMVDKYRCTDEYDEAGNYKGKPVNCMIRAYEQGIRDVLRLGLKFEKQGEQKPAEWSEDDKLKIEDIIYFLDCAKKHYASTVEIDACINWLKFLRPQKLAEFIHHEDESLEDAVIHQMEDDGDTDNFVRKGFDDIVLKYARLGAEYMARQGFNIPGACSDGQFIDTEHGILSFKNRPFDDGEEVIVQIRKK